MDLNAVLELADWRRRTAELYAAVRAAPSPVAGWDMWRQERERLFLDHPQSPIPAARRTADRAPRYFDYDPALRFDVAAEPAPREGVELPTSQPEPFTATRAGVATLAIGGEQVRLAIHWLAGYAGGLFVSFRDATSGAETYGAGRYVLDTAKGADLGVDRGGLVVDLNFAYQPSCSYDPAWSCPLAPRENWLDVAVRAGERFIA